MLRELIQGIAVSSLAAVAPRRTGRSHMHDSAFKADFICDYLAFDDFIHGFRTIWMDFDPAEDGTHKRTISITGTITTGAHGLEK
jgi:hypothetical protein